MKELNSIFKDRQPVSGSGKRFEILVYPNHTSVGRSGQNGVSVPARSDSAIDKRAASLRLKPLDDLFEQNRFVQFIVLNSHRYMPRAARLAASSSVKGWPSIRALNLSSSQTSRYWRYPSTATFPTNSALERRRG